MKYIHLALLLLPFAMNAQQAYKVAYKGAATAIFAEITPDTTAAYILVGGQIVAGQVIQYSLRCIFDPSGQVEFEDFKDARVGFIGPDGKELNPDKVIGWRLMEQDRVLRLSDFNFNPGQ